MDNKPYKKQMEMKGVHLSVDKQDASSRFLLPDPTPGVFLFFVTPWLEDAGVDSRKSGNDDEDTSLMFSSSRAVASHGLHFSRVRRRFHLCERLLISARFGQEFFEECYKCMQLFLPLLHPEK